MGWSRRKKLLFSRQGGLADQVQAWVDEGVVTAAWLANDQREATYTGGYSGSILRNCAWRGYTGNELVTNGNFSAWTGDDPDGWTVSAEDANNYVTEAAGGGACRIVSDGGAISITQVICQKGATYRVELDVIATTGAAIKFSGAATSLGNFGTTTGHYSGTFVATGASFIISRFLACDVTIDNVSVVQVGHLDAALTATSWAAGGGLVFDGATSLGTVYNHADLKERESWGLAMLVNTTGLGEGDAGKLYNWGNDAAKLLGYTTTNRLTSIVDAATTDATATTDNNQATLNSKVWVFQDYDNANALGNGRKIRLHQGAAGSRSLLTLGTDTAAVGTFAQSTDNLIFGNKANASETLAGTVYAVIWFHESALANLDTVYYPTLLSLDPAVS